MIVDESEGVLRDLLSDYAQVTAIQPPDSLEHARLEDLIWDNIKAAHGRGITQARMGERRDWFSKRFGGKPSYYEGRAMLYSAGEWAHIIFHAIDSDNMSLLFARQCIHRAKALARLHGIAPRTALEAVISQFQGTTKSIDNTVIKASHVAASAQEPAEGTSSKGFKYSIMHQAKAFAEASMEGYDVEPMVREKACDEFEVSLARVIKDFLHTVSRKKSEAKRDGLEKIGTTRFAYACEVLGLPIKFGAKLARRRLDKSFRERAAPLRRKIDSPNSAADKEALQAAADELRRVNDAYELLMVYVKQKELGNGH